MFFSLTLFLPLNFHGLESLISFLIGFNTVDSIGDIDEDEKAEECQESVVKGFSLDA